jgi:histidinol-phosphate aminotransferase
VAPEPKDRAVTSATPKPLAKLDGLPVYKPGKSAEATMAEFGLDYAAKLSSNENPFGPLPSVVAAITRAAADINRYPDSGAVALREALASFVGVPVSMIATAPGSSGVLIQTVNAFAGPGAEVAFNWRSFEAYPIFSRSVGATDVHAPLRGQHLDLDALANVVTERTRVVIIANPNNPTGTVATEEEIRTFLGRVPSDVLVVLDEAYTEFIDPGSTVNGVTLLNEFANLLVSRTMSKAYGLAGLRVGYAVAHPDVIAAIDKVAAPFAISALSQAAAIAALAPDAQHELVERVTVIRAERGRVVAKVRALGFAVPDSQANLIWLPVGERTTEVFAALERHGVVSRAFPGDGVRITIGSPSENDMVLAALATVDATVT